MPYIWENENWPEFIYDRGRADEIYTRFLDQKKNTDAAFSILDEVSRKRFHVMDLADDMVANLAIEDEHIDYDSVYSSVSKRLDLPLAVNKKSDAYADSICAMALDAINNHHLLNIIHDKLQPLGLSSSQTLISFHSAFERQLPIMDIPFGTEEE